MGYRVTVNGQVVDGHGTPRKAGYYREQGKPPKYYSSDGSTA